MDPLTDIRGIEKGIRDTDAAAQQELHSLRREIDTVHVSDIANYAAALAEGVAPPKARASKVKERIRELELRTIPGLDEALWLIVPKIITAADPVVNIDFLKRQLPRWAPVKRQQDPSGVLTDPVGSPRPESVCDYVLAGIDKVQRSEAAQREKDDAEERKRVAATKLSAAQSEYEEVQQRLLAEREATMSPAAATTLRLHWDRTGTSPWPPFDRYKFLQREDLLSDYGYVQPGMAINVQGKREAVSALHAGPAREPAPDTSPVATQS
jgi:hypothetical protein